MEIFSSFHRSFPRRLHPLAIIRKVNNFRGSNRFVGEESVVNIKKKDTMSSVQEVV